MSKCFPYESNNSILSSSLNDVSNYKYFKAPESEMEVKVGWIIAFGYQEFYIY